MAAKYQSEKIDMDSSRDQLASRVSQIKTLESCENCAELEDSNNHLFWMVDGMLNTVKAVCEDLCEEVKQYKESMETRKLKKAKEPKEPQGVISDSMMTSDPRHPLDLTIMETLRSKDKEFHSEQNCQDCIEGNAQFPLQSTAPLPVKTSTPEASPIKVRPSYQYLDGRFICDLCKMSFSDGIDLNLHSKFHLQQAAAKTVSSSGQGRGQQPGTGKNSISNKRRAGKKVRSKAVKKSGLHAKR